MAEVWRSGMYVPVTVERAGLLCWRAWTEVPQTDGTYRYSRVYGWTPWGARRRLRKYHGLTRRQARA